jgi:deoxycytidine triphosphate deaminase
VRDTVAGVVPVRSRERGDVVLQDYPDLAADDAEAARRFEAAGRDDPFPEIAPSLLNSADIHDYVRMAGILHPFKLDKLKSASYEAGIGGTCIWWNDRGQRQEIRLGIDAAELKMGPNSIAFVQVEPMLRLPDYIALRFNLKITHVHRGILLGTGPLVDPGFVGRLLIPLHNLTTNEYTFRAGEGLIWIEFTKTSKLPEAWTGPATPGRAFARRGVYVPFPKTKRDLEPNYYLAKASPNTAIRSSIPDVVREGLDLAKQAEQSARQAEQSANQARSRAETVSDTIKTFSGIALIVFLLTLAGFVYTTWQLVHGSWSVVDAVRRDMAEEGRRREDQRLELKDLEKNVRDSMKELSQQVQGLANDVRRPAKVPSPR